MPIIDQLASSMGRKYEVPNQELATDIAGRKDKNAIAELAELLLHKNKDIQSDSIKVLYEVASVDPALVSGYLDRFVSLLDHKNNRLQWGAMTAISAVTPAVPAQAYAALPVILDAAARGSVITKDQAVQVLIRLASITAYTDRMMPLLLEQLQLSLPNQLPMYAEQVLPLLRKQDKQSFADALNSRLGDMEKESKRKRVEKVIAKIAKL